MQQRPGCNWEDESETQCRGQRVMDSGTPNRRRTSQDDDYFGDAVPWAPEAERLRAAQRVAGLSRVFVRSMGGEGAGSAGQGYLAWED